MLDTNGTTEECDGELDNARLTRQLHNERKQALTQPRSRLVD